MNWAFAEAASGRVAVDPAIGNLRELSFICEGRTVKPLHTAHWVSSGPIPEGTALAPVERFLAGDFFCAPFGASETKDVPPHGWSANSLWRVTETSAGIIELKLDTPIQGASLTKRLRIADDAPLLYQTHLFEGGSGALPVAHHPMVHFAAKARLSTSSKAFVFSPASPLDEGKNALLCPAQSTSLNSFPGTRGGMVDLAHLPIAQRSEDFVCLVEGGVDDPSTSDVNLGWTAILRDDEQDIVFFLKDARQLPVTMIWHSNGGRDFPPWNGMHTNVVGVEDGCAAGPMGHQASFEKELLTNAGIATELVLGGTRRVAHVIGAVIKPPGWTEITEIALVGDQLTLADVSGDKRYLPFDPNFFVEA